MKGPQELTKGRCAGPILLLVKVILPNVEKTLFVPWRGKKVGKKILIERKGLLHLFGFQITF
jgi:hypothetical protein